MRSKTRSGKKSGQMQYELDGMIEAFSGCTEFVSPDSTMGIGVWQSA